VTKTRGRVSIAPLLFFAVALAPAACADESLGVSPFRILPDQPYLPIGLTRYPPLDPLGEGGPDDLLLVASTNMDQQFNAGTLTAYSLEALHQLVECGRREIGTPAMIRKLSFSSRDIEAGEICAAEVADTVWRASVATLAGGGPITVVQVDGADYVAVPTRFDQSVTLVRVRTDGTLAPNGVATDDFEAGRDGGNDEPSSDRYRPFIDDPAGTPYLACRAAGEAPLGVTSCSRTFTVPLGIDDPYSVQAVPTANGDDRLVVGHLVPDRSGLLGAVTLLEPEELASRVTGEIREPAESRCPQQRADVIRKRQAPIFAAVREVDAVALIAPTPRLTSSSTDASLDRAGLFIASNRRIDAALNLVGVSYDELDDSICERFDPDRTPRRFLEANDLPPTQPEIEIDLGEVTAGVTHRGLAHAPPEGDREGRLWAAVRIQEQVDRDTSAIVTLAHDPSPAPGSSELRVLSTFALGEEIATLALSPFSSDSRRLLYAVDQRADQIFVLDVSGRTPVLVNRIDGRFLQLGDVDEDFYDDTLTACATNPECRQRLRYTLAGPLEVAFDARQGARRMYVTNFENSTIAVIDVTDEDPSRHRLVARLGVDRNTANRQEGRDGFFRADR